MEFLALFLDSIFNLSAGQTEKPFLGWAPLGEDLTHVKSFSRIPQKMPTVRTCIILYYMLILVFFLTVLFTLERMEKIEEIRLPVHFENFKGKNPKVEVSAKFNSDIESRFAKKSLRFKSFRGSDKSQRHTHSLLVCQTMKEEKEKEVAAEPENRTFEKNNSKEF
ncbi:hypothetical protein TNCT_671053 [Trichonephila clavata]|uniref:Uncharacterized protein n=1 Tax=Trichonephila clavata TaxID=2740835 RepID=A0A8X6JAX4_TRICU|nr:hypothetical protein TNCT_671053 [Trichonephila clavata]